MFNHIYQWLITPLSGALSHEISAAISWHGRLMVFAWCFLLPVGVIIARFFKITLKQKWPDELDNQFWWIWHQVLQYGGLFLMLLGLILVMRSNVNVGKGVYLSHKILGYIVCAIGVLQAVSGLLRGTKGGPTDKNLRGDHFDMTRQRIIFEYIHKIAGYCVILLSLLAVYSGLVLADAPRWMVILIIIWWLILIVVWIVLQKQGRAIDTYQAIWGADLNNAASKLPIIGIGVKRYSKKEWQQKFGGKFNLDKKESK